MNTSQLTEKQLAFYDFIVRYKLRYRVWPSYKTTMEHFGFSSKNSVYQMQETLCKKGYLKKVNKELILTRKRPGFSNDEKRDINVILMDEKVISKKEQQAFEAKRQSLLEAIPPALVQYFGLDRLNWPHRDLELKVLEVFATNTSRISDLHNLDWEALAAGSNTEATTFSPDLDSAPDQPSTTS